MAATTMSAMTVRSATVLSKSAFRGTAVVARPVLAQRSARNVVVYAADRAMWYPGATPPKHLDGSMAGDYGFDPLRLGANPNLLPYFREAELYNGRWAMAAVAGILFTDLLGIGTPFWETGAKVNLPLSLPILIAIEVAVFAVLEGARYEGWKKTGEVTLMGAPFDPMGMKSDDTRVKELKNGRLAMLAFLGFCSQGAVRSLGPVECLKLHLADPGHNNIFTSKVGGEAALAVVVLSIVPIVIEAKKAAGGNDEEEFRPIPW